MVAGKLRLSDFRAALRSSVPSVDLLLSSPSLEAFFQTTTKTVTFVSCLLLNSSDTLKLLRLISLSPCVQVIAVFLFPSLFKMMTSFFAVSQNSMQKKNAKANLRPCVTRNKSLEEASIPSQFSPNAPCPPSQVASLSDLMGAERCPTPAASEGLHASGTKPKTRRTPERSGSSSDDAVFQPHKGRGWYKTKLSDADSGKIPLARTPYSQSSSSDVDASVIDTRVGRLQGNHKSRNSRSKPNSALVKSSSSSLSGSTSKLRSQRAKATQQRPKSPSTLIRSIPPLRRSSSSFQVQKDLAIEEPRDNVRNQSQNTEVMGVDKTFSTIENEAFLRKVEEVLSEIVEQKKRKILATEKSYSTLKPSQTSRGRERKTSPKSNETWVLSKHFDTSDHSHTFSHIITSHGKGRLRTRSKSSDLLETHEKCFTKLEPYKPRILRKESSCKFLKDKIPVPNKETSSTKKTPAKPKQLESIRTESPHTDEQKSSTIEENLTNTTNNTEADDTCYESDNGGSECALEISMEPLSPSKLGTGDHADASVDSAYTGSRGPTPDDPEHRRLRSLQHKLQHREKHMQHQKKVENDKVDVSNHNEVEEKVLKPNDNLVDRVKQEIIQEIKVVRIHSDYAITALIDLYRRKYLQIPRKKFDIIARDVKYKFGLFDGSFSDNKDSDQEVPEESPKKARVKFMEGPKQPERAIHVTNECGSLESKESKHALPKEAIQLREVLDKSKSTAESVRWLSEDEILDAKWASQILNECGIGDQSVKILENAKTWEEVAQALGFTSPFFNTVECGHEDIKECEKHCVPNLYGLPPLDFLQPDTEFLPSNSGNDSLDCKEALMALSAQSRQLSSDLSATKADKTSEVTVPRGSKEDSPRRKNSNLMPSHSRLSSATFAGTSSYSQSSEETVINLNCGRSESENDQGPTEDIPPKSNVAAPSDASQLITEKENLRIGTAEENIGNSSEINLRLANSVSPNESSEISDQLESDDDFFDSPGKKKSVPVCDESKKPQSSNGMTLQTAKSTPHDTRNILSADAGNSNIKPISTVNAQDSSVELKTGVSSDKSSESSAQISMTSNHKSVMPAIVSDNLLPSKDKGASDQHFSDNLDVAPAEASSSKDPNVKCRSDSPSIRKETNAPTSSLEFTDKLINNLSPTDIEEIYSPLPHDDPAPENSCPRFFREITAKSVGAKRSVSISGNHSPSSVENGRSLGLRQVSLLSRDLSGSNKDLRVAVSPTQPSLEGKITALATAYSSQTEDPPEWLAVADDVCKQFDISL